MSQVCHCYTEMQTASVSPGPSNVVAAGGCRLKFWHLQAAVARPLPCLHDTPVTPHVRAAAPNAAAAAAACIIPAPAVLRPGAVTVLRASPAAGRSTAAAADLSSACASPRGNLSGIWGSAGYGGAAAIATAATRLNKSWAAARSFRPAQQLLLAIFSFTAAAATRSRGPRALSRSTSRSMHRLTSLSPTLPVKAPAALAAAEEGHAGHDVIVNVPRLLYGTAWKKERTEDLVYTALRHGFRGVDTACQPKHYNEPGVGRGIARFLRETQLPRNSLFIQTKFTPVDGHDLSQPLPYDARASVTQQVQQSLQTSLHNLQCDYLDAVLLHSPLPTMAQTIEAWRVLEAAAQEGKVRLLGISNCYDVSTLEALYRAAKAKPALLQNRFYSATAYDAEVRSFCDQHGMVYEAFWTLTANPHMLRSRAVQHAAARTGSKPEQVWFRYLLENGLVVLTGTTSVHHMQDDLQSLSIEFSQEDRHAIDEEMAAYI